jgi:hypothetical protein
MAKPPKPVPLWRRDLDKPGPEPMAIAEATIDVTEPEGPAGAWRGPAVPLGAWREGAIKSKRPLCEICREREVPASRGHSKTCSDDCGRELTRRRERKWSKDNWDKIYVPHPSEPVEKKCVDCGNKFETMPRGNSERCPDCRRKRRNDQQNVRYDANIEAKRKDQRDRRAANPGKARARARRYYHLDAKEINASRKVSRKAKRKPRELWRKYCQSYFDHWKVGGKVPEACPKLECQEAKLSARREANRKTRKLWCKYCQSYFEHSGCGKAPEACPKLECQEAKLAAKAAADLIRIREWKRQNAMRKK